MVFIGFLTITLPMLGEPARIDLPNYQIGETARVDVVTPVKLVVIDPVATARLRLEAARNGSLVFRHDPAAADEVADNLQVAFAASREKFLAKVQTVFQKRELSDEDVNSPRFRNMVQWFQWENKLLPLDLNLARIWVQGGSDKELIDQLTVKLRAVMQGYIRLEEVPELPAETKAGPPMTQMLTISRDAPTRSLAALQEHSRFVRKAEIVTLERAKRDFRNTWPAPERTLPRIVEKVLKTNCVFDAGLTQQVLAKKIDSLYSANQYEPEQAIVHRGEVIDARIKAGLDQLRVQSAVNQLQAIAGRKDGATSWWWWCGVTALLLLAGLVLWRLKRRLRNSLLPVPVSPAALMQTAGPAAQSQGAGFMLYLAHLLRDKLVQRLFSQRTGLLATQRTAATHATEMEEKLSKIQTQMQNRFESYQQRITELEKELAVSEGEKRDLLRAKIVLARQEYDEERERSRLLLN